MCNPQVVKSSFFHQSLHDHLGQLIDRRFRVRRNLVNFSPDVTFCGGEENRPS
jgi:hypothetical protein